MDFLLAGSLIFFAGLRGDSLDYNEYVLMFESIQAASQQSFFERVLIGKDFLFGSLLIFISDSGFGIASVFVFAAILSVGTKAIAFRRVFGSCLLGLFIFTCTYYFLQDFTQIRAAIAIGFCFNALVSVVMKRPFLYLLMSFFAVGFHAQAALFIACTAPLLIRGKARFLLMAIMSMIVVVIAPLLINVVIAFDNRPGIAEAADALSFNGVFSAFVNLFLLIATFLFCRENIRSEMERELAVASIFLVIAGFAFLMLTYSTSVTLAWRAAEMLMSFGVFVVVAALRGAAKPVVVLLSGIYCLFNIVLLARGALLVDYRFAENLGACCAEFW
ncbi:hypothetical protein GPA22_20140 [Aromatoleum toluvorans]|uniref:EpsG family protein n=1 Tax=Aromatoleum toluvorans TaxID=92002 RepID=A0ABX1Q308_9RHOO|nr:EpsG family protein [Aromatoleum toluvorans]NMG46033.1 hypothetical protein [Aromatoleum toluvorans]